MGRRYIDLSEAFWADISYILVTSRLAFVLYGVVLGGAFAAGFGWAIDQVTREVQTPFSDKPALIKATGTIFSKRIERTLDAVLLFTLLGGIVLSAAVATYIVSPGKHIFGISGSSPISFVLGIGAFATPVALFIAGQYIGDRHKPSEILKGW